MRIALYGTYNHQDTGPSRVTEGFTSILSERGHDVLMIVHGDRTIPPDGSIELHHLGATPTSLGEFLFLYRSIRTQTSELEYDIFHPLEEYPWPTKIRTVQWTMDSWERRKLCPEDFRGYRFMAGEAIINVAGLLGARWSDYVVASSPETNRQMKEYWRQEPDGVIPLGIDEAELEPPAETSDEVRILIPGRVTPKKGQKRILDRLDPDGSYRVDIVGGISDEEYYNRINRWHDRHHGFVSRERLNEFYRRADVVVVPSYHENFSMTAVEAIAKGCVVVIMDSCGFATLPEAKSENGIYCVSDGEEAGETVRSLVDSARLQKRKERAYELAKTMTWEAVTDRYLNLYERLRTDGDGPRVRR